MATVGLTSGVPEGARSESAIRSGCMAASSYYAPDEPKKLVLQRIDRIFGDDEHERLQREVLALGRELPIEDAGEQIRMQVVLHAMERTDRHRALRQILRFVAPEH